MIFHWRNHLCDKTEWSHNFSQFLRARKFLLVARHNRASFVSICKLQATCSNDHLYKTTPHLRWPMLSPPKPISIKSLLYNTTTCLTQPYQKNLSKTTTTKLYPAKKYDTNIRQQTMHKKETCLWLYLLYCYFIIQSLLNVYKNWTIYIKLYKIN